MGLIQVAVRRAGHPSRVVEAVELPWVAGRGTDVSLPLDGAGVWDRHLVVEAISGEGIVATVAEGALASVGGQRFTRQRLRNGDEVTIGDTCLCFTLAPPRRRSLSVWGFLVWLLLAAVLAAQAFVFWRLLDA